MRRARPRSAYGVSKLVCEEFARTFARRGSVETICLRPALVAQPDIAWSMAAIAAAMEGADPPPPTAGRGWRDLREPLSPTRAFVSPGDAARAFRAALEVRGLRFGVYFVTGPDTCALGPTVDLVARGFGAAPEVARPSLYADDPPGQRLRPRPRPPGPGMGAPGPLGRPSRPRRRGSRGAVNDAMILRGGLALDAESRSAERRDLLIVGGAIRETGPVGMDAPEGATERDVSNCIVIPGLVNAHTHGHGGFAKGRGDRWSLELLLNAGPWISGERRHEDRYLATLLNAADAIRRGCTAIYDLTWEQPRPSVEGVRQVARAYDAIGVRGAGGAHDGRPDVP